MRRAGHLSGSAKSLALHDHVLAGGSAVSDLPRLAVDVFATADPTDALVLSADLDSLTWEPAELFSAELESGRLQLVDTTSSYAQLIRGGDPSDQLRDFDAVLRRAQAQGYTGLRVVADNTVFLAGPDELARRWIAWEQRTDRWQADRPVNGVCFFDVRRVPADRLAILARLHPLTVGVPEPSWRMHHETDGELGAHLVLGGQLDAADADGLARAVRTEMELHAERAELTIDVAGVAYAHHSALWALSGAGQRGAGPRIRLVRVPSIVRRTIDAAAHSLDLAIA